MRIAAASLALALALPLASAQAAGVSAPLRKANRLPAPVTDADYRDAGAHDAAKVDLGRQLFFDKILSGNENISCATCHHPLAGTADGLSLPVGEGGRGLATTRDLGTGADSVHERVPRNAPALFNLGAREFTRLFHDGRVGVDAFSPRGIRSPAGAELPAGLESVLAAQALFPVTSATEMAGQPGENPVADAAAAGDLAGPSGVWALLAARLRAIPEYVDLFEAAFPDVSRASDITFVHAANAIAAFEAAAWRSDQSAYDRYLRRDRGAMSRDAVRGMKLFYGRAGCSGCHAGPFQTDHDFHAIAVPPVGPGKGDGPGGHDDFGRERVTGRRADRYRFRTPSLRNVALTAPYMHDGAYESLRDAVLHHLDPEAALARYDRTQVTLPSRPDLDALDFLALDDAGLLRDIADASELRAARRPLRDRDVDALLAFLRALTDPRMLDLRRDVPPSVPSGLPLAE